MRKIFLLLMLSSIFAQRLDPVDLAIQELLTTVESAAFFIILLLI